MKRAYRVRGFAPGVLFFAVAAFAACSGDDGENGIQGPPGEEGPKGDRGPAGPAGPEGPQGPQGEPGTGTQGGTSGTGGVGGDAGEIAVGGVGGEGGEIGVGGEGGDGGVGGGSPTGPTNIVDYVKQEAQRVNEDLSLSGQVIPLNAVSTDTFRTIEGLQHNVVASWLDPLNWFDGPNDARFGANADYIAYFGDGWQAAGAPQAGGSSRGGWLWVNHEYVSGTSAAGMPDTRPTSPAAPVNQFLQLAQFFAAKGDFAFDVSSSAAWSGADAALSLLIRRAKEAIGGSWVRVEQDPSTGNWAVNRGAIRTRTVNNVTVVDPLPPANLRYDATSRTLFRVTGPITLSAPATDDAGTPITAANVVPGTLGNCSGAQTPWGTIITAEENAQDYYGDYEPFWGDPAPFTADPADASSVNVGGNILFDPSPVSDPDLYDGLVFGQNSIAETRKNRDYYGYLVEIDPGEAPSAYYDPATGKGHQKIGAMGRARWENASFRVGRDWKLIEGEPLVVYAGADRRGGSLFKFVSSEPWSRSLTTAQTRNLLSEGTLYVAHFESIVNSGNGLQILENGQRIFPSEARRGAGTWIELSVDNTTQNAPNAAGFGVTGAAARVGAVLKNQNYNSMGGFVDQNAVLKATFTASMKLGIRELNRPEDVEYNPFDQKLWFAFTYHGGDQVLNDEGAIVPGATGYRNPSGGRYRTDAVGAVFALEEDEPDSAATSLSFTFYSAWNGVAGPSEFGATRPDNLLIDREGGVWFGTDGNPAGNGGQPDGFYYLSQEEKRAFRILTVPSDAELTGPAFTPDGKSLFVSVQHPGEGRPSNWPGSTRGPLSSVVAVTLKK